jgi:tRNA threonylcarbamoyladenosine biosynthesis protein TsaB
VKLLAIETATESCSVALSVEGEVRERSLVSPRGHADLLLPWVEELLAEGALALSELDAIAFSRGPGSFTSLRIGIGATQGLAWGADIPVIPISSLQSTAQVSAGFGVKAAIVALDARMNEVYCGTFHLDDKGLMQPVGEEQVCPPSVVTKLESKGWSGVGVGFERYEELVEFSNVLESVHSDIWPGARAMLQLSEDWIKNNQPLPAEQAQAVYLRDNVARKSQQPSK